MSCHVKAETDSHSEKVNLVKTHKPETPEAEVTYLQVLVA